MRTSAASCLLLGSLMLLAGCTLWPEHQAVSNWSETTGAESLERSFWKDVQTKNWTELERHVAGNYTSITPQEGRFDRAGALQHLQQVQLDDYSLGDVQTELNGSTLVVTYTITMRGSFSGQPLPSQPVRMMSVWQQQKAGWMTIAHSVIGPVNQPGLESSQPQ